jgi:hypothetical protein
MGADGRGGGPRVGKEEAKRSASMQQTYQERFQGLVGEEGPPGRDGPPSFESKEALLEAFLRSEEEYSSALQAFRGSFIETVDRRDTDDRRRIRDHPKLAVALEMLVTLSDIHADFLQRLQHCRPPPPPSILEAAPGEQPASYDLLQVAEALLHLSRGMGLYEAYTSLATEAMDGLAKLEAVLKRFLKSHPLPQPLHGLPVEQLLLLPCQRLPQYQGWVVDLLAFLVEGSKECAEVSKACNAIRQVTEAVDKRARWVGYGEKGGLTRCLCSQTAVLCPDTTIPGTRRCNWSFCSCSRHSLGT